MRDRLVGIAADFIGEHYQASIPRPALIAVVDLLVCGRRVDAIKTLRNASPKGFTAASIVRMRNAENNPAVQWAIKRKAIPMGDIIGLKDARDIVIMLELVGGIV